MSLYFLIKILGTASLLIAVTTGTLFLFYPKCHASFKLIQRICGIGLLLLSLHIAGVDYYLFNKELVSQSYMIFVLVVDVIAMLALLVVIVRYSMDPKYKTERVLVSEKEDLDEDDEQVEQIENPNVEDFIFFQQVEAIMANEKLFCEPDLSRELLAAKVGTNRTYLVRSIKTATGKTFSEYITNQRTNYAATLLSTTDEPLDVIGTLVGFRSKSAYYRAFSAAYNCSPSEYRRNSVFNTIRK